jgi:hypothetical protein
MAYVAPTADEFLTRFPEFEGQDDAIDNALIEAGRAVDTNWTEGDYKPAIMYYAAHLLTASEIASSGKEIASESIGPLSVSYFKSGENSDGWITTSGYGQMYLRLLRLNRGGPRVI